MIWLLIACLIGQLTELGPTLSYTLDKVGNRESRASSIAAVAAVTNTFNNRDWLSGDTYDASGNTTLSLAFNSQPDVYDFEDHLIIRHKLDGSTVNLSYDADGLLRQKTVFNSALTLVSATGYLQDTMNPTGYAQIMEERINAAAGTTVKLYAYGSDLISQSSSLNSQPATLSYFSYDGLGSVRELTNASGAITDAFDYDAFGVLVYRIGTTDNAYLYRGERFESDIGQYYLRARFYNQNTGRFWNQDSYEGSASDPMSLHKYLYAQGSPLFFQDPTGNYSSGEIVAVGALVGIAAAIWIPTITNLVNPHGAQPQSNITVHIWNFQGSDVAWGHASMTLSDGTHISWWPSSTRDHKWPSVSRSRYFSMLYSIYSAPALDPQTFADDVRLEGHPPDWNIRVKCLDEGKIKSWWSTFKTNNVWSTFSQNCSTTVADGLKAGGGAASDANTPLGVAMLAWTSHQIYWSPNNVAAFADGINKYQQR